VHRWAGRGGLLVTATLLLPLGVAAPAAAVQVCEQPPATAGTVPDVPWPQLSWDPAETVWPFSTAAGVTVAVLDTGVQADVPQLAGRVLEGVDLVRGGPATVDCVPHGTALAGIVSAQAADGVGFRGLAPDATVLPVQVTDQAATAPDADPVDPARVAAGIDAAVGAGAGVVLLGVVLYADDPGVAAAVQRAQAAGVVVVAPVGDGHDGQRDGTGPTTGRATPYPAAYDGVIGVGAVDASGLRAAASQVGDYVDLVAPGQDVVSAALGGQSLYEGTAFAAAYVAAGAALLVGDPDLALPQGAERVAAVARRLTATAVAPPSSTGYGAGLFSPGRALTESLTDAAPAPLPGRSTPSPDPAAEARAAAERSAAATSTGWALGLGAVAVLVAVVTLVVPRARRRGWRTGRPAPVVRDEVEPGFIPGDALFRPPPLP